MKKEILAKRFPGKDISTFEHHGQTLLQNVEIFHFVATHLDMCGADEVERQQSMKAIQSLNAMFNRVGGIKFNQQLDKKQRKTMYAEYLNSSAMKSFFYEVRVRFVHVCKFFNSSNISEENVGKGEAPSSNI